MSNGNSEKRVARQLQRQLELTAELLNAEKPLTAAEIRDRLTPGSYSEDKIAFRRTFERDKKLLRSIGVPIENETIHWRDPPEEGYRIRRDRYRGRNVQFKADELAALHLATGLVHVQGASEETLKKYPMPPSLTQSDLAGVDEHATVSVGELPFDEPLAALVSAAAQRRLVSFRYSDRRRRVEPWQVSFSRGHWYLSCWDNNRKSERTYRIDRIQGDVTDQGRARNRRQNATDLTRMRPWEFGTNPAVDAIVLVDADQASWACHLANTEGETQPDGSVLLKLSVRDTRAFRMFLLGFLDHATVLEPQSLRQDVVDWLRDLL